MPLLLYLIFILSGAAGLFYESVWSRYLSLFVGHGAYAQVIVLVIFLGGMTAEEAYFSDKALYGDAAALAGAGYNFTFSSGNASTASSGDAAGYDITVQNASISAGTKSCQVAVGGKAAVPADDGVIKCP